MSSFYNADLKPLEAGEYTHPYDHAARLFVADNLRLAPKQSFLYYVCINIDTSVITLGSILQSLIAPDGISSQTLIEQYESGLLVKRVDLPKFTIGTKTLNAYNRKNIIQTNISYEPINLTFHDDAADIVTNFWNDYYTYYYRDSDYNQNLYQQPHKYQPRTRSGWGYSIRNSNLRPFLRNIQIFSLHNKRFTEYTLINPTITNWRHGEHNSAADAGIMENQMTVAYETVKYRTGYINPVDVNGFSILHYDLTPSPISTSTTNIYTNGGVVGVLSGSAKDLARPDGIGSGTGVFGSILNAYNFYKNVKNLDLKSIAKTTLTQIGGQIINGAVNSAINSIFVPTASGTAGYGGVYGSSQVYASSGLLTTGAGSPYANPITFAGATIAGSAVATINGAVVNTTTQIIDGWTRGLSSSQLGQLASGSPVIYQVGATNGTVSVNSQGQPVAGQSTTFQLSADGQSVIITESGKTNTLGYNPNNLNENVKFTTTGTDTNGTPITTYYYNNGTQVTVNTTNNQVLQVFPGTSVTATAGAPTNTSALAASGQAISPTQPQYYTDPRTGITYTTGGSTSASIVNSISGATGLVAGSYVGQGLNQALNSTALGKTVIGQTVSGAISTAVALQTGRLVNNGLQPILNSISGTISQGWDSATASIKNVVGSWTNSGGFDPKNPNQNIVSQSFSEDGAITNYYKNGAVVSVGTDGKATVISQGSSSGSSWFSTGSTPTGQNADVAATTAGYGGVLRTEDGTPIGLGSGGYATTGDQGLAQAEIDSINWYNNAPSPTEQDVFQSLGGPTLVDGQDSLVISWDENVPADLVDYYGP